METRRQFLAKAAFLSGTAGLSGNLLGPIERTLAIEPQPKSTFWDAEHVVILMQENRSFDHTFGTLRGVRGFNDPRAITLPDGNPVWVQTNATGESYAPFRLNIKDTNATWMGCLPHGRTDQVDARNDGRYDKWLDAKRSGVRRYAHMPLTMGYYNRDDIPFYYALADAFTICDQHFCSVLSSTTPNRCYLWTGTIRTEQNAASPANLTNSDADHVTNVSWPTFPERLEDLGVSWKIYQNEVSVGVGFTDEEDGWLSNFGDNPIEYFSQFNVRLTPQHRAYLEASIKTLPQKIAELQRRLTAKSSSGAKKDKLADLLRENQDLLKQIAKGRLRWNQQSFDQLSPREKSLLARAFATNAGDPNYRELIDVAYRDGDQDRRLRVPKGDLFHQFRQDVASGTLPAVSWFVAPQQFSDHPDSAWFGAWYIAEALDILTQNPDVWKKTIFMLTYDENDGYFDHVPPFVAPDPRRPETGRVSGDIDAGVEYVAREDELKRKPADEARGSSIGLGYRVPLVIASPWSRGGFVCSQVFDHTSPLQFLEKLLSKKLGKEVRESNISQWRRTVCGDLTSAFQSNASEASERISYPSRDAFVEQIHRAQFKQLPSGYKRLSPADIEEIRRLPRAAPQLARQEPGTRPSCALPYELAVDGALSDDRRRFLLNLEARNVRFEKNSAGSPFVVYARFKEGEVRARDYAVSPGDKLEDSWQLDDFAGGRYHLAVYGPNGFFREFQGDADDPPLNIVLKGGPTSASDASPSNNAGLRIVNRGEHRQTVRLLDLSYKHEPQQTTIAPGATEMMTFNGQGSFGWYDLILQVAGNEQFVKRYAGRVETGLAGVSDPAMAGRG